MKYSILKDSGREYDCYEDMYQNSTETYNKWEIWDKKNKRNTSWIDSFNEFIKEEK